MSNPAGMEFTQFVRLIAIGLQARVPMHVTGFPGVGKTEFAKSLEAGFAQAGVKCKVVILVGSIRERVGDTVRERVRLVRAVDDPRFLTGDAIEGLFTVRTGDRFLFPCVQEGFQPAGQQIVQACR